MHITSAGAGAGAGGVVDGASDVGVMGIASIKWVVDAGASAGGHGAIVGIACIDLQHAHK